MAETAGAIRPVHNFMPLSYNGNMDTIIYLKMDKRREEVPGEGRDGRRGEMPVFHIRLYGEEELAGRMGARTRLWPSLQLVCVTIPWEADQRYRNIPAELSALVPPFFGYSASVETMWDASAERWLKSRGKWEAWEDAWPYPAYRGYRQPGYAQVLLRQAMQGLNAGGVHLYVIGYEEYLPGILAPYLKYVRSIAFVEAGEAAGGLLEYLDLLFEEEGLAADLRVLAGDAGYRGFCMECPEDSVVLDFSGEEKIAFRGACGPMAWIDMESSEQKKNKILVKSAQSRYFSIKEAFGRLDTAGENGYNT